MLPLLTSLREEQVELFVIFQARTVGYARTAIPPLLDADVAEAAAAVAATLETAGKGIIYEHQATSVPARRLAEEFRQIVRDLQQRTRGASRVLEKDLAAALRCLERAARTAAAGLEGDEPPVYLGLARRVTEQVAAGRTDAADGPEPEDEPRLILP